MKGFFITFEGGEGSGKTVLIDKIGSFLQKKKIAFIKTREPGSTFIGEKIRDILLNLKREKISYFAELSLFLAARAQHIEEVINPALNNGKIVLCDRFNDSTIVYQGYARGIGLKEVKNICNFITQGLNPNFTIYLDVTPEIGLKRVKDLDRLDLEKISFHKKVKEGYHILINMEKKRFFEIDADKSEDEVFEIAKDAIINKLKEIEIF
ncbi:MAG: hypothetical protein AMS24_02835 [Chlamydiae bacterium SM23_39]|nr:MAG: hypothetical protein AMS24_02835 [Chlamydiae bacterium SM23_39]